jgi:hypothetical protein
VPLILITASQMLIVGVEVKMHKFYCILVMDGVSCPRRLSNFEEGPVIHLIEGCFIFTPDVGVLAKSPCPWWKSNPTVQQSPCYFNE